MKHFFKFCIHFFEKIILPYHCVMCLEMSDQRRDLCHGCQQTLPLLLHTCYQCGLPFSHENHPLRCGRCIQQMPYFDETIVGFNYQTPIDHWLKQFKFHKKGLYMRILTEIYCEKLMLIFMQHPEKKPQMLIAMPLHWRRLISRGFNQSYSIAKKLSRTLNIPLVKHHQVKRVKYTQAQSGLHRHDRKQNMRNAFYVQKIFITKHVAIIDDVVTTGNTVNELSKQLKLNGIHRVSVWTLARAN